MWLGQEFKGEEGNVFAPFNVIFALLERLLLLSSCSLHFAYILSGSPKTPGCEFAQGPCEVKL